MLWVEVPLELVARTVPPSPGSWQSLLGPGHLNIPQDRHWSLYLDGLCQYPPSPRKSSLSSLRARSETSKRPSEAARLPFCSGNRRPGHPCPSLPENLQAGRQAFLRATLPFVRQTADFPPAHPLSSILPPPTALSGKDLQQNSCCCP